MLFAFRFAFFVVVAFTTALTAPQRLLAVCGDKGDKGESGEKGSQREAGPPGVALNGSIWRKSLCGWWMLLFAFVFVFARLGRRREGRLGLFREGP